MRLPLSLLSLIATTAAFLAGLAPGARAQDVLVTNSGKTYEGKVLSNDGTSVEIETTGGMTMKLPYEQLTPKSQYRMRRAITQDAQGYLDLADWCVSQTLYDEAKTSFRKALDTDATMADAINARVVVARTTAATEVLARAKALQATKPHESRELLGRLVQELPLEEASQEAARMLAEDNTQRKQGALSRPAPAAAEGADARPRQTAADFSEATQKLFKPIVDSYHKMLDATQEGLKKNDSAGISEFEKALKEGEKIRKEAEKLRPKAAQDAEITEAMSLVDTKLEEALVDVRINLVDSYLLRTSYNQAADVVKAGLAEYPKNDRLRGAMDRVTSASAENSGGGWVIGGGRLR